LRVVSRGARPAADRARPVDDRRPGGLALPEGQARVSGLRAIDASDGKR
jgi:hypothetical protein